MDGVEPRVLDLMAIDLPDGSVDGVLCRFAIMLVDDPGAAVAEIARVLRPGGRVALAVWASSDENDWMTATGRSAVELGLMERPDPRAPGPFRLADVGELRQLLADAGLEIETIEDVPVRWRRRVARRVVGDVPRHVADDDDAVGESGAGGDKRDPQRSRAETRAPPSGGRLTGRPRAGSCRARPTTGLISGRAEWRGPDLNRRHHGFQPCALPTELPRLGDPV